MATPQDDSGEYIVVARRYRPQNFEQLVGQQQATRALRNAIETNRVGHAYLFTGARGVGKTSTARIFSKALNCAAGPSATPCDQCDICLGISAGDDVDVLEIDGASNRGIDEIRQLRSNVNIRPSRSRFKIYIIDEVHMLTKEAFNALLKTLEEPPDHVKFIFCTTDPEKIPITVLSRCQRFDFAPVEKAAIVQRLQEIVDAEGATAEPAALELLARRAAGSMRDSQSLLEQLMAFGGTEITEANIHGLLGTADASAIEALAQALAARNAALALEQLDQALARGVDVGQISEQLLGYLRDIMAATVGASADVLRHAPTSALAELQSMGQAWGLTTILAAVQIIDQALARMRQSVDRRTLIETAVVRVCCLEDLESISELIGKLQQMPSGATINQPCQQSISAPSSASKDPPSQASTQPTSKKKRADLKAANSDRFDAHPAHSTDDVTDESDQPLDATISHKSHKSQALPPTTPSIRLSESNATLVWNEAVNRLEGLDANFARNYTEVRLGDNDNLVVAFAQTINAERCRRPAQKRQIESILWQLTGRTVRVDFQIDRPKQTAAPQQQKKSQATLIREAMSEPFVKTAMELFSADVTRVTQPE